MCSSSCGWNFSHNPNSCRWDNRPGAVNVFVCSKPTFCLMHAGKTSVHDLDKWWLVKELCECRRTEDGEGENHVLHDFVTEAAAHALGIFHDGFQVALVHPDLHLLLHHVGTGRGREEEGQRGVFITGFMFLPQFVWTDFHKTWWKDVKWERKKKEWWMWQSSCSRYIVLCFFNVSFLKCTHSPISHGITHGS